MKKRHTKTGDLPILIHTVSVIYADIKTWDLICSVFNSLELVSLRGARTTDTPLTQVHLAIVIVGHETKGMKATDTIYDDSNQEQMDELPAEALHRNVDLAIINADTEGEFSAPN